MRSSAKNEKISQYIRILTGKLYSGGKELTRSELIEKLTAKLGHFSGRGVELVVNRIIEAMSQPLSERERIEIRGFDGFTLHKRPHF